MSPLILAFGNKARHGKDTAAAVVINSSKLPVKRVAFADALRQEITNATRKAGGSEELLGSCIEPGIEIPDWVKLDPNPDMTDPALPYGKHPLLMQWWGTNYRRSQDPDYWIKKWKDQVCNFDGIVVAPDVRFINEAAAVKSLEGYTIKIQRLNSDGSCYFDPYRDPTHASETDLDGWNWDFQLSAKSGQIEWLKKQVTSLLEYLKE